MNKNDAYTLGYAMTTAASIYMILTNYGQLSESIGTMIKLGYMGTCILSTVGMITTLPSKKSSKKVF